AELAPGAAAEEGAEDRLHHVLAVEPGGQFVAQLLLGQPGQALGVPRTDFLRRLGVAAPQTSYQLRSEVRGVHEPFPRALSLGPVGARGKLYQRAGVVTNRTSTFPQKPSRLT